MKKAIAYLSIAIFLGITLILIPTAIVSRTKPISERNAAYYAPGFLEGRLSQMKDYALPQKIENPFDGVIIFVVGLLIATPGYLLLRKFMTKQDKSSFDV